MRDFLRRAFLENAALKIVALLLSVTLFIVVHGDKDAVISFTVRVGYTEPSDRVLVTPPVDEVRVTVKGAWTQVKRFDDRSVEPIHVDLSRLSDGEYTFQDDMVRLPPGLRVTSINPPSVTLRFESTATKVVQVTPMLTGEPARGFRVERRTVTPSHVMVRGPRSVIEAMTEVRTRPVDLAEKRAPFLTRVPLETNEAHVTVVDRAPIEVEVTIGEEPAELTIGDVRVEVRAAPGVIFTGARVSPVEVALVLRGSKNAVEALDRSKLAAYVTVRADDVGVGPHDAQVIVDGLPPGLTFAVHPRHVTLTAE